MSISERVPGDDVRERLEQLRQGNKKSKWGPKPKRPRRIYDPLETLADIVITQNMTPIEIHRQFKRLVNATKSIDPTSPFAEQIRKQCATIHEILKTARAHHKESLESAAVVDMKYALTAMQHILLEYVPAEFREEAKTKMRGVLAGQPRIERRLLTDGEDE